MKWIPEEVELLIPTTKLLEGVGGWWIRSTYNVYMYEIFNNK